MARSFSRDAMDLKQAYKYLNSDISQVKSFLVGQGIKESEIIFDAADISKTTIINTIRMEILQRVFFGVMSLGNHFKSNQSRLTS